MTDNSMYKTILDKVKDGVYFVDKDRRISFWNKSAEDLTGFNQSEVIDHFCYDNILNHVDEEGNQLCHNGCPLHKTLQDGQERQACVYFQHKDGHRVKSQVHVVPIYEGDEIIGAVETFNEQLASDYLMEHLEELKTLAYKDQLTGLPNRRYLDLKLETFMEEYQRMGTSFALAIMDIDHFKRFNDSYGHDVGDDVLVMLASVFQNATRGNDIIGRWGGEEFVIIFQNIDEKGLNIALERIRMLVESSGLRSHSPVLRVTISIGSAIMEDDTLDSLFKRADVALYESKDQGRNRVTIKKR